MILKKLQQIKILAHDSAAYFRMKYLEKDESSDKTLFVDFQNPNLYHRFFYLLLKFYQLSGYKISYPMNFSKFRNLRNGDHYLSLILKEKKMLSIKKNSGKNTVTITDENFSADYFKNYFEENNLEQNAFHIPMSFHPLMYHKGIWNDEIAPKKERTNSIFCYGNFLDDSYLDIEKTGFKVINRRKLYEFFKSRNDFILIKDKNHLTEIQKNKPERKSIFAEKYTYSLPIEEVREQLSHFRFYLCCPGVVMPLCHNVVEAMSVGTVPIIQKEYAEVMYPNLEHGKNALIFENLGDLERMLNLEIFEINADDFQSLSKNAQNYYDEFLVPTKVTEQINSHLQNYVIYLNAEHRSVKFIK